MNLRCDSTFSKGTCQAPALADVDCTGRSRPGSADGPRTCPRSSCPFPSNCRSGYKCVRGDWFLDSRPITATGPNRTCIRRLRCNCTWLCLQSDAVKSDSRESADLSARRGDRRQSDRRFAEFRYLKDGLFSAFSDSSPPPQSDGEVR
jgi:hypothetical protein